jgi:hypothetical protein
MNPKGFCVGCQRSAVLGGKQEWIKQKRSNTFRPELYRGVRDMTHLAITRVLLSIFSTHH